MTFKTSFKRTFQTKNKFQIFKLFTESLRNKGKMMRMMRAKRGMMRIIV